MKRTDQIDFRKSGKALTTGEKWMVLHVLQRCKEARKNPEIVPQGDSYKQVSYYTGVSKKVVVDIARYFKETGTVPPLVKPGNKTNHQMLLETPATARIRECIFDAHRSGKACNSPRIQDLLHEEFRQEVQLRTIQRYLHRLGFEYRRTKKRGQSLVEKPSIRQQRHTYLHTVQHFRQEGYHLIYRDESFLHHYHGQEFSWFADELDELDRPTGKGRRWCFIHAMSEQGLLPGCELIFEAKKSTGDYHGTFNFPVFYEWFTEALLPNLPHQSCIIMDRATYHVVPEDQVVPTQMRKAEIQQWLTAHHISWEDHWLKPKLAHVMKAHLDPTPFVTKEALAKGHKVLVLPVHHPELNPIELVWAFVKNLCAKKFQTGLGFQEVRKHLHEAFTDVAPELCQKFYTHVKKIEEEYWQRDVELEELEENENGRENEEDVQYEY